MKIQKGIVKYKDRNDIVCTYGVADDGTQYYFLDENVEKKMQNGNRIASTALVEAVDSMAKTTHIGVIDKDGKVVIPFENKSIKPVNDNVLIVEKAFPTSQSVLDAIEQRNDSVAAPKLVSTSAALKDKLNAKMGPEGRFLVNEQFSEATVCDIDGKNLVNDQYYSYIGVANNELYLSTNVVDSDIVEFSLTDLKIIENNKSNEVIDVQSTTVDPQTVENALVDNTQPVVESTPEGNVQEAPVTDETVVNTTPPVVAAEGENVPFVDESLANASVSTGESQNGFAPPLGFEDFFKGEGGPTDNPAPEQLDNKEKANEVAVEALTLENTNEESIKAEEEKVGGDVVDISHVSVGNHSHEEGVPFTDFTPPLVDAEEVAKSTMTDNHEAIEEKKEEPPLVDSEEVAKTVAEPKEEVEENVVNENHEEKVESVEEETTSDVKEEKIELPPVDEFNQFNESFDEEKNDSIEEVVENKESTDWSSFDKEDVVEEKELEKDVEFNQNVIDPNEVASTVDKDNNGILDSSEDDSYKQDFDSLLNTHYYDSDPLDNMEDYGSYHSTGTGDNIMNDVVKSMSELLKQNREQKSVISQVQNRLEDSESQRRMLAERYKEQAMRYENLTTKLRSLDGLTSKLESKVKDQNRVIEAQERELKALRSQLNSKQDLVKLLADAKVLLGEDDYSYQNEDSYYRRAA